jgi:hypothetical protein
MRLYIDFSKVYIESVSYLFQYIKILRVDKMSDEPSEEEIKAMLDKAKEEAEKKRKERASKVGSLETGDTSELETILEKKMSKNE